MTETCSSPEDKPSIFVIIISFTIPGVEYIIGIIGNGFIMVINGAEWVQNKKFSTSGRILFFLSLGRIALESCMMIESFAALIFPSFYKEDTVYETFRVIFMFLTFCSLWFATWLSIFYFAKIANFNHPLFLRLKWRITGLMPWLLWSSVMISFCCSAFFSQQVYNTSCNNSIPDPFSNSTKKKYIISTNMINLAIIYNVGMFIPLILFILAAILLIISLKQHTLQMESNTIGSRNPSMEAHIGAIKAISSFLILYIFNFVALLLYMSNIFEDNSVWIVFCKIVMAAYPSGHSVLLILGNPKLRNTWGRFQHKICSCYICSCCWTLSGK
ncbi:taste receptor type 2 member 39-like [Dromiciops gliroides]|uniref:taste receptor type 2 member 39-like n=1 Tax=Dromiciops gliroides TaxID=33562 RepID=UPI001CC3B58F|nr:taste receptor type 2 member 39-like [Dromiciops gliroides]